MMDGGSASLEKKAEGHFGWVRIGDRKYLNDVIVHVDGGVTERPTELSLEYRSDYFHTPLSERELGFLAQERPEVVIVGAGYRGMLNLTPRAKRIMEGYEHVVCMTHQALELMNIEKRRFVAILHLTC